MGHTEEFFDALARQEPVSIAGAATGTVRFEVVDGAGVTCRSVTFDHGEVRVGDDGGTARCVVTAGRAAFEAVCTGAADPMAALLRGELCVEGDLELLVLFQRLLPRRTTHRGPATDGADATGDRTGARS